MDLPSLIQESHSISAEKFLRIVKDATGMLRSEDGHFGNLTITDRLIRLEPVGEALIISDLHGDTESFLTIFRKSKFLTKMQQNRDATVVFLGDYGDRGAHVIELYYAVLSLKLAFPTQIILLRGNHEGPPDLLASPHELPHQLQARFKEKGAVAYSKLRELFACLYNAVHVEEKYLMVHGGLPPEICGIQEIAQAAILHPRKPFLEDLLWSDPGEDIQGFAPSIRGAGNFFGKTVTQEVLKKLNVQILIRGHESCPEGFKFNHDGKVLTLFSRKGPPYFNEHGAYLVLPLSERFETAKQLLPYIHKF